MAKNKTVQTEDSVLEFINAVPDETKRKDSLELLELMKKETGLEPKMWGPTIIGFGRYHYKYASGHEGDAPLIGFSPRKPAISLYLSLSAKMREDLLQKFGKHKTGKSCIYINKMGDINTDILKQMIANSVTHIKSQFPS